MPLYLGIPFTILILVVASQARIGNITLEWVAAALAGLWSARQSRKYMLQRFERVFPLEPLALGITVTLLFPFAFPWFLRLRHRALRGRLPLRTRPSRLRIVLLVLVIGGGLLMQVGYSLLRRSAPWKGIESSLNTVETLAGGPIEYRVANDMLSIGVANRALYAMEPGVQQDTARAIARAGLAMVDRLTIGNRGVDSVEVRFHDPARDTRPPQSPSYHFLRDELE